MLNNFDRNLNNSLDLLTSMNRTHARKILREFFPCYINGQFSCSYEALRRKDPILIKDIMDYIQWSEPMPYKIVKISEELEN